MLISSASNPNALPTYAQIAWLGGDLLLASNIRDNIRVWKGSTSASPGFTRLLQTTHTVRDANAYYTDARLEMPALPVLAAIPLPQVAGFNPTSAAREGRPQPLQYANGLTSCRATRPAAIEPTLLPGPAG
jgi:hypothetical protein